MKSKPSCVSGTDRSVVRSFRIQDYDAVVALWRRTKGVGLNESDTRPAVAAFLRRNPRMSFVAVRDDQIVGAVLCGHDGRRGYLHHLAVARRHQRHGIGRQLVNACLQKLRQAGIPRCSIFIYATNTEGVKFWTRVGWKLRRELRLMQTRLDDRKAAKRICTC